MEAEFRYVIHYCYLRKLTGDQILAEMQLAYGPQAPGRATIFRWLEKFREGKKDIKDEQRPGRLPIIEYQTAILESLEDDPYASTHRLEELTGINQSSYIINCTFASGSLIP